jgi:tRNA(fMet)-specific endonuclease VapC
MLTEQLEQVLSALPVLALEPGADHRRGELRAELEPDGVPIGANDRLIAAHALALGLTLCNGQRERVPACAGACGQELADTPSTPARGKAAPSDRPS